MSFPETQHLVNYSRSHQARHLLIELRMNIEFHHIPNVLKCYTTVFFQRFHLAFIGTHWLWNMLFLVVYSGENEKFSSGIISWWKITLNKSRYTLYFYLISSTFLFLIADFQSAKRSYGSFPQFGSVFHSISIKCHSDILITFV